MQITHLTANTQKPSELNVVIKSERPYGEAKLSKIFWDIYDISLWTDAENWSPDTPFAISIKYLIPIDTDQLVDTTIDELERLGAPNPASYRNQLNQLFPNVSEGDRITSYFNSNYEVSFFFNGSKLGSIKDDVFGKYFSDIWLSSATQESEIRDKLLKITPEY